MGTEKDREKVKPLFVKKEERLEELVSLAEPYIGIDEDTGEVLLKGNTGNLTQEERVLLAILGRYLAFRAGLVDNDEISVSEISENTGIQRKVVSARLVELKSQNAVTSPARGEYTINPPQTERYLKHMQG